MPESWNRIKEIFDAATQMRPEERAGYLDRVCDGDDDVRVEVESLLSSFEKADVFLESPAVEALAEEIMSLPEGWVIGHYRVVKQIGAGGMGEVYLAEDTKLDRSVAIKLLNKKFERHEDNVRRFVREAKAASALNHPNILTIFEIGDIEGSHYIVSEYIKGRTLREMMASESLELPTIVDIAGQIASALAAAHKARIVHRDLKPENVIVRDDGYVKVVDFGIAKLLPGGESGTSADSISHNQNSTAAGMILGTVNYMSPEQARGKKVDERTDIFSLGVVLYEMITGKVPFAGDSIAETFAKLITYEPEPINSLVSSVPDEMQQVVSRMLEKEPENRYQSIRETADDLKRLYSGNLQLPLGSTPVAIIEKPTVAMRQIIGGGANTSAENPQVETQESLGDSSEKLGSGAQGLPVLREHRYGSANWTKLLAVIGVIAILLGGFFGYRYFGSGGKQIDSIAVMPFVNESGDPQVEYLSDGMTDTLISSLSELPNIKVKARTSVFRYKGKEIDPKAVGRELGVQAIVSGRMAQRDGRTSVVLEVIDTETEDIIFSTKYNKPQSELVTLQSDIARDVSAKLKSKLSGAEVAKVTKTHTADPEALQLYLKGQFYAHKGGRNNVLQAIDYFNKAIEKDPNYALAYAALALTYDSYPLYNIAPPAEYRPKAKAAAIRAVELDDSLAEAHVASGHFQANAEQEFRRAIELNPNYAEAHHALCILLPYSKRFDEAIAEGRKAQELDPSSAVITTSLGAAHAFARRPDEAIEILRRAHEMDPTLYVPLGYLGFAQTLKNQYTEAIATFRKAIEVSEGAPNAKSHLAYALAKAGRRDEALKLVDELKRQAAHEFISSFHFAVPYIGLGNKDEAFFWLEKGVAEQSIGFAELDLHPWYDDLRTDPRFEALLKRTNPLK